jgi:hypothetical protein
VPVAVPESAQERTTLQRVVANRSGLGSRLIAALFHCRMMRYGKFLLKRNILGQAQLTGPLDH